jgi:hypothetical protein
MSLLNAFITQMGNDDRVLWMNAQFEDIKCGAILQMYFLRISHIFCYSEGGNNSMASIEPEPPVLNHLEHIFVLFWKGNKMRKKTCIAKSTHTVRSIIIGILDKD